MKYYSIELWPYNKKMHEATSAGKIIVPVSSVDKDSVFQRANRECFGSSLWPQKETIREISETEFEQMVSKIKELRTLV